MADKRIDSCRIKTPDTGPHAKGGQGSIAIGIVISLEEVATWDPEQLPARLLEEKLAIKKLDWDRKDAEKSTKFFNVCLPPFPMLPFLF